MARILHLVGNCTYFPSSVSNDVTLVAWTQPQWVGVVIPENLVNSVNQGCLYCLFFHHTSSWASHYLPSLGLRSQTRGQPGELVPNSMDVGRGLQGAPEALPSLPKATAGITSYALPSSCFVLPRLQRHPRLPPSPSPALATNPFCLGWFWKLQLSPGEGTCAGLGMGWGPEAWEGRSSSRGGF